MHPYIAFSMEQRKKMVKADPSRKANIGGLAKEIGAMWRQLSDAEKAKYGSRGGSKTRKVSSKKMKATKEEKPTKPTKATGTKKTKRALSPYMKFFKAQYPKLKKENPSLGVTDIAKKIGQLWSQQK